MTHKFSIITPCYRPNGYLSRVHSSLLRQRGEHLIEWIIVDDFSNDEGLTADEINSIVVSSPLTVKPIYLSKNFYGSKSTEAGAAIADGQYVLILDQDDQLTENAIDIFYKHIKENEHVENLAGICARCINQHGELIGTPFPWKEKILRESEVRHEYRIRGELFQCTRVDVIREYFKGMVPGYTNGWAWNRISNRYSYVYSSDVVRVYDIGNPCSVSNLKRIKYVHAQFDQLTEYLLQNVTCLKKDKFTLLRMLMQWGRIGIHNSIHFSKLCSLLPASYLPYFAFIYPFSLIKSGMDVKRGSVQ